jgi:hypothetical protein
MSAHARVSTVCRCDFISPGPSLRNSAVAEQCTKRVTKGEGDILLCLRERGGASAPRMHDIPGHSPGLRGRDA